MCEVAWDPLRGPYIENYVPGAKKIAKCFPKFPKIITYTHGKCGALGETCVLGRAQRNRRLLAGRSERGGHDARASSGRPAVCKHSPHLSRSVLTLHRSRGHSKNSVKSQRVPHWWNSYRVAHPEAEHPSSGRWPLALPSRGVTAPTLAPLRRTSWRGVSSRLMLRSAGLSFGKRQSRYPAFLPPKSIFFGFSTSNEPLVSRSERVAQGP